MSNLERTDSPVTVVVHADASLLAESVAAQLVTRLVDAQSARGRAHLVLTGGTVGIAVLRALAAVPARDAVDWRAVDVWWGDERFLPFGHPERNETQAREALLDALPLDEARVHPMPCSEGPGSAPDADTAADRYAEELRAASRQEDHADVPTFDVLLLGMGHEGHVASLFPEQPAVYETERTVVGVHRCPKPPPTRVSMTFPAIRSAEEVWLVVDGEAKAGAVAMALSGAGHVQVPAAGATGRRRTLWLLDRAAAAQVPAGLPRRASP